MSFATDDLHTPPLLFHHNHRDLRSFQHQQQQHRSSGSYPSHDLSHHHLQDPRQSPYSAHLALNSVMVPRQSPNHSDAVMPPDHQFMISAHPQALDMQQQQRLHHSQSWAAGYDQNGTLAAGFHSGMPESVPSFPFTGYNSYHPNHRTTSPPLAVNNTQNSGSVSSTGVGGVGGSQNGTGGQGGRMTLAGSLDPSTGIFYRTPEHPRLRTAQACEKCRTRKAKCSGEHPTCKRCQTRGLICEYAKEGRVRGPNKPKSKAVMSLEDQQQQRNYPSPRTHAADRGEMSQAMLNALRDQDSKSLSTLLHRRDSLSLGEHRANRPRPPNLNLDTSRQFRLDAHAFHLDYQLSQHIQTTHTPGPVVHHYLPPPEEQHMIHTAPPASQIPANTVNYHAIPPHIQVGTISPSHGLSIEDMSPYTYEENRSPSTSSNVSMHGSTMTTNQSMVHIQNTYAPENGLGVDHNSAASSPSAYRTSGDMTSSPTVSVPGIPTPNGSGGANTTFDGIHPIDASASLPLVEPAWVGDIHDKHNFTTMQFSHDTSADDHVPQDVLLHHQHHAAMAVQHDGGVYAMNAVGDNVVGDGQVCSLYPIDLQMR